MDEKRIEQIDEIRWVSRDLHEELLRHEREVQNLIKTIDEINELLSKLREMES